MHIVILKGYCRRDPRGGFKSQIPNKLMTEEGSPHPVPFSTIRISLGGTQFVRSNNLPREQPLEPTLQANPKGKGYLVVSKPTNVSHPTSFHTEGLDSALNSPTYAHRDPACGFCSPKKYLAFQGLR